MAEYKISNFKYAPPTVDDCYKHLSKISYKSPIEVIQHEFQVKLEGDVMKAVKQHDIFVDKEELIKALQYDRDQYTKGFQDGCRERMDELINQVRADTVRKMQEKVTPIIESLVELMWDDTEANCIVESCNKPDSIGCGNMICIDENKALWVAKIDEIAEEMLEGIE